MDRKTAMLALALLAGAAPAMAQEAGEWVWQVTPYVWATGIGGDITPYADGPTVSFDSSFSEVVRDLDAAFFLSGYARRDRLVFLGDFSHSSSSRDGLLPGGLPAEGKLEQTSLTLAAGYRVVAGDGVAIDLLAGARHWRVKGSVTVPPAGLSVSPRATFTDPILAARANIRLAPRWSAILYGDIGGFGVGSERTSQIVATVNYQAGEDVFLSAGYRTLSVDYRDSGTRIDPRMSGPIFGATWRF